MKFLKVMVNEFIKIMKKKSTIISFIILIICIFGCVFLSKYITSINYNIPLTFDKQKEKEYEKERLQAMINTSKEMSRTMSELIKYCYDNNIIYSLKDYNVYAYDLITDIATLQSEYENALQKNETKEAEAIKEKNDEYREILYSNDYNKYMDLYEKELNEDYKNGKIQKEKYEVFSYLYKLDRKYEVNKTNYPSGNYKNHILNYIQNCLSLMYYTTNTSLDDINRYKDNIQVAEYYLKNDLAKNIGSQVNDNELFHDLCDKVLLPLFTVIMILIAGNSFASEFSKKTIKQTLLMPLKRWKIILAKILVLIFILIISSILLSLLMQLVGNIFFGELKVSDYVYMSNGEVHSIPSTVYLVLKMLIQDIQIFVYMLFAIMLVVLTRNTSISMGCSGIMYAFNLLLLQYPQVNEYNRFIPFNFFILKDLIFKKNFEVIANNNLGAMSISFAVTGIIVIILLMCIITFSSFNKKKI